MRRKPNPIAASVLATVLAIPLPAYAQPSGGSVAFGQATIAAPNANSTVINQSTQSAIINWQGFSIDAGASVQFNQPNAAAITLNRVLGGSISQINGALTANGQVWIINQNGILFGKGSQVNVSGLLATTSDIADADFAAGNYNFSSGSPNAAASIDNAGSIHVANGGSAVLSASHVGNTGLIQADAGQIVLGGASAFTIDFDGDNLLRYAITTPVSTTPTDANGNAQKALVENGGTLTAAGGKILMTARAAANVADNVVNNTGMVSATSASIQNGEVVLDAGDGSVQAGGTISATGNGAGQTGGNITLAGANVTVADNAVVDASGDQGGGTIAIGGGLHGTGSYAPAQNTSVGNATIRADANTSGNGGTISIWSTGQTNFSGSASANGGAASGNGGTIETSGQYLSVAPTAKVTTTAANGASGDWLLDPSSLSIVSSPPDGPLTGGTIGYNDTRSTVTATTIQNTLAGGTNVTLQAVNDIFIFAAVDGSGTGRTLTLDAGRSIYVDANVNMTGGSLVLSANNQLPGTNPHTAVIYGTGILSADTISMPAGGAGGISIGASGTPLLIGSGTVSIGSGGGDVYIASASGATGLTLGSVDVGAGHLYATSSGSITIAPSSTITSSASGDAIILSSQTFINDAGAGAITETGTGRWLVYTNSPFGDTFDGLQSGNTAVWNTTYPTAITASGDRFVFAYQPTVSVAANVQTKVYGQSDPTLTYTATSTVFGTTAYTDSGSTIFTGSLSRAAGENVGSYAIGQGSLAVGPGYTMSFTGNSLNITPATLTVTANPQSKVYGQNDPSLTYSVSGLQFADTSATVLSGALSRAPGSNVGSYAIGQGTLAANSNYTIAFNGNFLQITPAALLVTANNQSMTYGGTMPTLTVSYSGFVNGDTSANLTTGPTVASATPATANAGTYAGTITASGVVDNNYTITYAPGTLTINKAALLITANNQTMTYGGTMPALTVSYSGLVNGDTAASLTTAPTVASATPATANAGTYAGTITASGAVDNNYTISYAAGTLTINKAALLITANNESMTYGGTMPALTVSYSGFVNGDTATSLTTGPTVASGTAATANAGTYVGTLTASGAVDNNYSISYAPGTLTIGQAALLITANNQTMTYGGTMPTLTVSYSGFVNGDTSTSLTTGPKVVSATPATANAGTYAGTITASGAVDNNYTISYAPGTLTIGQALLSVTANTLSKVYGASDPTLTYDVSGLVNGDTNTVFTGTLSRAAGENVGTYLVSQGTLSAGGNYTINFTGANFSITQALLNIAANPLSKVYGSADPTLTYVATGFVGGDTATILSGNLTRAAGSNVGSYAITQGTLSAGGNYTIAFTGANFSITPALLSVTADTLSKVYGASDPTLTYTYSGLVNGDTASIFTGNLARAAGENVGSYAITQGTLSAGGNYSIAFTGANFAITQALLNVTANAGTKVYGAADPTLTYSFSGLVNGDTQSVFTGSLARNSGENVGNYAIALGTLTAGGNYAIKFSGANFSITPAQLSVTADPHSKVYGAADPTLTYTYSGLVNGDTSSVFSGGLTRATGENVGSYAITQGALTAGGNYTIDFTGANFSIAQALLNITANPLSKVYGAADPTLTYSATGFVGGDTAALLTGSLSRATGENVGSYAIALGTLSAGGNYAINFTGANFSITPAVLNVTANTQTKVYGSADPTLTYAYSGLVNGDTSSVFSGNMTRAAGENVGSYAIAQGTLTAGGNYTIAFTGANLSITQALLNVTANPQSKVYGSADPMLTYTFSGLVNGDTQSVFTGALTRAAGSNVGSYAIAQGTLSAGGNYTIAFTGANLSITQALLNVTANPQSKVYGSADPTLTYSATGFIGSDTAAILTGSLSRAAGENVGSYAINQGTLSAGSNYTIAFSAANLAITPATLTYTAGAASRTYGAANPVFSGTLTGFVNGDTQASATSGTLSFTSTATAASNVGNYAIDGSGLTANNGNYVFAQASANATALTINPATLSYIANHGSIQSGSPIPTLTGTVTGFVNGDTQASATTGTLAFTTTATSASPVGSYAVTGAGLTANNGNYVFVQAPDNATALTITKAMTLNLPPEFNNVVTNAVQTDNSQQNGSNTPLTLPSGDTGDGTGGLYNVVGHTPNGQTPPSANTVVLNGPIAQLVADTIFGSGYVESPTLADRASSALTNHFVSSYHENFSSWGNDAFWQQPLKGTWH